MKWCLRWLARLLWNFRAYNTGALTAPGPVLLIPNHVSWFDWLFLGVCLDDDWKFVTSSTTAETSWVHKLIMVNRRTFSIDTNSPYAVRHMAEHLQKGGRLVLFAEGRLSKTGTLMKLFDGTGFLIHKTGAKVITAYIRSAQRLPFSPNPGKKLWFPEVTTHFSDLASAPQREHLSASKARAIYTRWLRDEVVNLQFETEMKFGPGNVPLAIAQTACREPRKRILEDVTLKPLTYRRLLTAAGAMASVLQGALGRANDRIGVLLPNVNGMPITLLALWRLGKTPAVLNFSTGPATMLACSNVATLKQIVTSRVFVEKAKLDIEPLENAGVEFLYLEDLRKRIGLFDRLAALFGARFAPTLPYVGIADESTAVVLFTSGSEGVPKGVELTHRNILANIRQVLSVCDIQDDDRIFNCLPMFHSFGLTAATILPLVRGLYSFTYPSPLHYRVVPTAVYNTDCTIFFGTNTFLNGYARKAHPYDFRSLRYLFAGAEKLQEVTALTWARKFGVRILEGYGATECSPCISVNTPLAPLYGAAGRLLPGMDYKLKPIAGVDVGGRLLVRGPNVMKGYLNPDANAKFLADNGWYDTGDIVSVDEERFLHIQGRMKRFAKISGEMVSLTAVEEALAGAFPQYGIRCQVAVVAVPDVDKGERLIAVANEKKLTLKEIREVIRSKGHSNLNVPREVQYIRDIPKLGTGKVNHRELQKLMAKS